MTLFTLWRNPETAVYEVRKLAEVTEINAKALLTVCSKKHPFNIGKGSKSCSRILTFVDSEAELMFNTECCILLQSACRFTVAKRQNTCLYQKSKEWKQAQKFMCVKFSTHQMQQIKL